MIERITVLQAVSVWVDIIICVPRRASFDMAPWGSSIRKKSLIMNITSLYR